jgi:hypothetical protein
MMTRSAKTCDPTTEHNLLQFTIPSIFEVLAVMSLNIHVLWDVTLCH